MQLLLKLAVANLFDDVGVAGLVNFEGGVAMGCVQALLFIYGWSGSRLEPGGWGFLQGSGQGAGQ